MALDGVQATQGDHGRDHTRPVVASLRWGLGWTVVAAALGATTGCVAENRVQPPVPIDNASIDIDRPYDDHYWRCVDSLGPVPDAAEHRIDACQLVAAATVISR